MEQNWTNPFIGDDEYTYIHAGSGCCNTTFPDGSTASGPQLEFELGLCHLFDWTTSRSDVAEWLSLLRTHPGAKNRLVIDCGAYSLWTIGKQFDIDKYIEWLNEDDKMDLIYWAVSVDKIPGTPKQQIVSQEETDAASEETWSNYLKMIKEVRWPKKLLPVFHYGEDFKYLKRMLEFTFPDGDHIPYMCITNHDPDVTRCIQWYDQVFSVINHSSNPNVKLHILQEGRARVLKRYKIQTSDASSAIRQAAFGQIEYKGKNIGVGRTVDDHFIDLQPQYIKDELQKELDKIGRGLKLEHLKMDEGDGHNYRKIFGMMLKSQHLHDVRAKDPTYKEIKQTSLW